MIRERKDVLANSILLLMIGGGLIWLNHIGAKIFAGVMFLLGIWGLGCGIIANDHFLSKQKPTKAKLIQMEPRILWSLVIIMAIILGVVIVLK